MKKRLLALFLVLMSIPISTYATNFSDVSSNSYSYEAIQWAVENNIADGTSPNTFAPKANCTRGEAVTFLYRIDWNEFYIEGRGFDDVAPDSYYHDSIQWAVAKSITNGTGATSFSPNATVTRAQAVTFLYRFLGSPTVTGKNTFRDVSSNSYYAKAVIWAVKKGITNGTSANTFSPDKPCTREQIITFLYRAIGDGGMGKIPCSDSRLCDIALRYYRSSYDWTDSITAAVDRKDGDIVTIRVYEDVGSHITTQAWYSIDRHTLQGTDDISSEEIDFSPYFPNPDEEEEKMIAYAIQHGMVSEQPDNPMVGIWRWDSDNADFKDSFWLVYPNGQFNIFYVGQGCSVPGVYENRCKHKYQDSKLSLIIDGSLVHLFSIVWDSGNSFSIEDIEDSQATRIQIDSLDTEDSNNPAQDLSLPKLCASIWKSNGYRLFDTTYFQFKTDGTVIIDFPSSGEEYVGKFTFDGNTVIVDPGPSNSSIAGEKRTLRYNKSKNILVNVDPSATHIVEQDHDDGYGNYVPAKEAREIFEPWSDYTTGNWGPFRKRCQSIIPQEFAGDRIKEFVRPYLQALSNIDIPHKYCDVSSTDTFIDLDGMTWSRVLNYNSLEEVKAAVSSYVTKEYLEKNFMSIYFQTRNGKLYLVESATGWPTWDANSVSFYSLIGDDEIAVRVDEYGSGDNYGGEKTIYFKEVNGRYVVSGISWEVEATGKYPDHDFVPPGYDPV